MSAMPMREDCKHFESRTYRNGETVRKCDLDLAPEAPWRCPDDCPSFSAAWSDVELAATARWSPRPPHRRRRASARTTASPQLLDEAEDIINAAGPEILADWRRRRRADAAAGSGAARTDCSGSRAVATSPPTGEVCHARRALGRRAPP